MIPLEKTMHLDRPQHEVFDLLSDPANDALYRRSAKFAEWSTEGLAGVGSTIRAVDRFVGREVETVSEITMWDSPKKDASKTVGDSFPARFTLVFESVEAGTNVTSCGEIEFKGLPKPVERLFGRQIGD